MQLTHPWPCLAPFPPPPPPPPQLTLWDKHVASPGTELEEALGGQGRFPVLAAKGVRVGDFNGKNLSTIGSSLVSGAHLPAPVLGPPPLPCAAASLL